MKQYAPVIKKKIIELSPGTPAPEAMYIIPDRIQIHIPLRFTRQYMIGDKMLNTIKSRTNHKGVSIGPPDAPSFILGNDQKQSRNSFHEKVAHCWHIPGKYDRVMDVDSITPQKHINMRFHNK